MLVIRGRVYVVSGAGLAALDAGTGETLWQVAPGKNRVPVALMTDAHHLVVGYEHPTSSEEPQLVTYDFAGGAEVGRFAYPEGTDHLVSWDGKLFGYDEDLNQFTELS